MLLVSFGYFSKLWTDFFFGGGCLFVFKEFTFSAAFSKYFMSRSIRLLSFLSVIFITCLPYLVVQAQRTELGLWVEVRGRQVSA